MVNMDNFLSPGIVPAAAWLGKKNWVRFENQIMSTRKSIWDDRLPGEIRLHDENFWQQVHRMLFRPYSSDKELICDYAMTRAIAFGPKMFCPTSMQCQSLEHTDVDIPFSDYYQPFESLIIDFPKDYQAKKMADGLARCPQYILSWFDKDLKIGMVACQFENQQDRIVQFMTEMPDLSTIEDMISKAVRLEGDGKPALDNSDFDIAVLFQRIAINLNLIFMYGGGKLITQPLNREKWKRYRELKKLYEKERNHGALNRLREQNIGEIDELIFEKNHEVIFYSEITENEAPDTLEPGTHASSKPGWRRGHWRNQPYGPRNNPSYKRIRLKPVYVWGKRGRSEIDLAETKTAYVQEGQEYRPERKLQ